MSEKMITIIGVGHVFDIKDAVREAILELKPDIVCVELDPVRYQGLIQEQSGGTVPVSYRLLSIFQRKIARDYGGRPGDEMLAAIQAARDLGVEVAFIDADAQAVFGSMWAHMSFQERVKLLSAGFFGLFAGRKQIDVGLKKFENNQEQFMEDFGNEFPSIKKALIDDRDRHMATALKEIHKKYRGIVAVIGDGHVEGVKKLLEGIHPETIRLRELLSKKRKTGSNQSVTVSMAYGADQKGDSAF